MQWRILKTFLNTQRLFRQTNGAGTAIASHNPALLPLHICIARGGYSVRPPNFICLRMVSNLKDTSLVYAAVA